MYKRYFLIFEKECKLFFCRRFLYGYNFHNQMVYKAKFESNIQHAKRFKSVKTANKVLDMLPPEDTLVHIPVSEGFAQIRLANLVVMPITINYDS